MDSQFFQPSWADIRRLHPMSYVCAFCGNRVSSSAGYSGGSSAYIYICPHCEFATHFYQSRKGGQFVAMPGNKPGSPVGDLPDQLAAAYEETRQCAASGCYTASVMMSRKMLMSIAVAHEAPEDKTFKEYVDYLANNGWVPPTGKAWVDLVRTKGNDANHKIDVMNREDAVLLVDFIGYILKAMYEFPSKVPKGEKTK